jgi:AmmeMemoRadiSam system protein B
MVFGRDQVRQPAVAGMFYPDHPLQLKTAVERLLVRTMNPVSPFAVIVPHAGYIYSGATAGKTFASVDLPKRMVILCPNHTGAGAALSCMAKGTWNTPLGPVPVNEQLADALMRAHPGLADDASAHRREHAIEVQLPFLQVLLGQFSFVPLCIGTQHLQTLEALGGAIASVAKAWPEPVALVVSSDMNHYEAAAINRRKDDLALKFVKELSPDGLHAAVVENRITMCGFAPAVAALYAARALGANRSDIVDYTHSGMVTGDDAEVVSYAGVRIYKECA